MRRWNGWGDDAVHAEVKPEALAFLVQRVGPGTPPTDATLAEACAGVGGSRLPAREGVDTSAEARLRASYGQSLGDWLRLRFGRIGRVVDGVVYPTHSEEVRAWLDWAGEVRALVLPYGGGTSVVGHLTPAESEARPVLSLNLSKMRALLHLDADAQLATFGAGVLGPDVEAQLRPHGLMLGHFPQSYEYASLGGWIATRSSGQQSLRYGRTEQWFAGARVETPTGTLRIPPLPASAAGPDLREWVLGSEGRIGVITEATVRAARLPEVERFLGVFFPSWDRAVAAVRALAQGRVQLSLLRLANATETVTTLRLAGHAGAVQWLERYLALRGCGEGKCLLFVGVTGTRAQAAAAEREALAVCRGEGGVSTGTQLGSRWAERRFASVYLRNALWERGYMVDTMETAVPWSRTTSTVQAIEDAGRSALGRLGERAHAYTHLSHVYSSGSSVYSTFVMRAGPTFEESWARWEGLKRAVSEAIVASGGTISHQHGVGRDHAAYLPAEKGERGMEAIRAQFASFDPAGVLDSGNVTGDR